MQVDPKFIDIFHYSPVFITKTFFDKLDTSVSNYF